ncbi:prepilin peptidase [Mycobacterium sp. M23085]|uniref:prepilin peptidase n=1 Tax=Mycobacterium sp. M23085 TaxID=3378087 RepID=UPI003878323D
MRIAAAAAVLAWLAALSWGDIRDRRLPNTLTLTGAAAVLGAATLAGRGSAALAGTVALTAIYLAVHWVAPGGMGGGDVKLALGLGALTGCFGVGAWFLAALGAPLLTAALGALAMARGAGGAVPHGPSMCLASAAGIALTLL